MCPMRCSTICTRVSSAPAGPTTSPTKAGSTAPTPPTSRKLVAYWIEGYDWRKQERAINAYPQFRTEIDGVPIHLIHVRGKGPNPKPLILSHGWPWTFWEYRKVIDPLSDPGAHGGDPADAFD